ncbi:unnamed protein product, partial [Hapterophycus canaliculatus]
TSGLVRHATAHGTGEGTGAEEERVLGRNDETPCERKNVQQTRGGVSVEGRKGNHNANDQTRKFFSSSSPKDSSNPGVLHGGDSGGYYEDDFDDFFEEDSEDGEKRTAAPRYQDAVQDTLEETFPTSGGSGDKRKRTVFGGCNNGDCDGDDISGALLTEVVYRPPSGGSRGKGERPKSAARQGRSSSLNVAG